MLDLHNITEAIKDHEAAIERLSAAVADWQTRQRLYNEVEQWLTRWRAAIVLLRVNHSDAERQAIRTLIEALGVVAHPYKTDTGELKVKVEVLLFGEAAMPSTPVWSAELDAALDHVLEDMQALAEFDPDMAAWAANTQAAIRRAADQAQPAATVLPMLP